MNKNECIKILACIGAAYPYFNKTYKNENESGRMAVINLWHAALAGIDYSGASAALMQHIKTCKFAPCPAEILELAHKAMPDNLDLMALAHAKYRLENPNWCIEAVEDDRKQQKKIAGEKIARLSDGRNEVYDRK